MPRLLVAGRLHPSGEALLDDIRQQGIEIDYVRELDPDAFPPFLPHADAMVLRTQDLTAAHVEMAPRLRVVSRHGVGYDAVDLDALNARRIGLAIVGDENSVSVAEQALMLLLAASKQAIRADRAVREHGGWDWRNRLEQKEISGKNLLIMGFGRAGRQLARLAEVFRMNIQAFDPYLPDDAWPDTGVGRARDLHAALGRADFLSIHIPKVDPPAIGPAEFAAMKPGMVIVNTARGGVMCEATLLDALDTGQVHAAGLDVFATEPPLPDDPLLANDRIVLSPHIAGISAESSARMAVASVQNAVDYLAGTIDPALVVNWSEIQQGER